MFSCFVRVACVKSPAFIFLILATILCGSVEAQTVRIAVSSLPPGKGNPLNSGGLPPMQIWPAVFETATKIDSNGKLTAAIASSWESDRQNTWTFEITQGRRFSNGEALTAHDIAATINLLLSEAGQRFSVYREVQTVDSVKALDDATLVVTTTAPDSMLPAKLAGVWILPDEYLASAGIDTFTESPHGSGPFMITDWRAASVRLAPNPNAFIEPQIEAVQFSAVPDMTSRVQALVSGAVQIALNIGIEDVDLLRAAGIQIINRSRASVQMWQFITESDSPLQDVRVRRALNYGVDMERIVSVLLQGQTRPTGQTAAREAFGYNPDLQPYPYDPEKARALLAEAGYADGFDITFQTYAPSAAEQAIYQRIVADLREIGVRVELIAVPFPQHIDGIYNGAWVGQAFNMIYGALPSLDPIAALRYHSCLWQTPWICRPDIVDLIRAADRSFDMDRRESIVHEILRRLHEDPQGIMMYESVEIDGLSPTITSYSAPFGFIDYAGIEVGR